MALPYAYWATTRLPVVCHPEPNRGPWRAIFARWGGNRGPWRAIFARWGGNRGPRRAIFARWGGKAKDLAVGRKPRERWPHLAPLSTEALNFVKHLNIVTTVLVMSIAIPLIGRGQIGRGQARPRHSSAQNHAALTPIPDPDTCRVRRVTSLPGSHQFASDFIEAIASDPTRHDADLIWALTADLSTAVPYYQRAMYISKSTDGGATWRQVARIDSRYFNAGIGEGLRNGFIVAPGATYFVITTQRGAFQVFPQRSGKTVVKPIAGPHVPYSPPKIQIPKKPGDPVRANALGITADGKHLIIGYGYFDLDPQIFTYHQAADGSWIDDGPIPGLPSEMDILSMKFDDPHNPHPGYLYVGTGDQAYRLDLHAMKWSRVDGVGPDSAIHAMNVVGGLHIAACWGVYEPVGPGIVKRVTDASFLLHPGKDDSGPNLRAYGIEVDPSDPNREVVTSITGVYISADGGETWRRLNNLPEEEFRSAHFNSDGTILVSGITGTFLVNPFSDACSPHLKIRGE